MVFIIESNLSIKLKKTHFWTYVYMNPFLCYDLKNSILNFVQAF